MKMLLWMFLMRCRGRTCSEEVTDEAHDESAVVNDDEGTDDGDAAVEEKDGGKRINTSVKIFSKL